MSLMAAQQRVRRGPTPEVFFTKRIDNSRLVTARTIRSARSEMRSFADRDGGAVRAGHDVWLAALQRHRIRLSHRVGESSRWSSSTSRTASFD